MRKRFVFFHSHINCDIRLHCGLCHGNKRCLVRNKNTKAVGQHQFINQVDCLLMYIVDVITDILEECEVFFGLVQ